MLLGFLFFFVCLFVIVVVVLFVLFLFLFLFCPFVCVVVFLNVYTVPRKTMVMLGFGIPKSLPYT